ncbi:aspartyl-phosphate phosphatase Spo0E family protein [Metabacillus bambusae]|uniref:Aspartyl-phosphate phosphatase Spo0E family protein n=1 Tax=Metabacillus bambusae TaxID=2795218 RepID=A0ABS3N6U1_9BACI|nr:aspartyl-phosphate phosphatase Spo0E family protein [Metabacillus bambusae]MBO1514006.1 aspartyl-phosphate phosphatase Spo0E family protein [Metabacillus bambusae]
MKIRELLVNKLEYNINSLRNRMISIGELKGLNHPDTIKCSQKLDLYLNKYDRLK